MSEFALIRDLAIIWIAALISGYLCVRLKQPLIAGYILAGIAIGPSCLKLVSNQEQVSVLAEFGVALLLFALGVEVSLRQIFSKGYKIIAAGLFQIAFSTMLGWFVANLAGLSTSPGSGLLFGAICALSSSVVVTKILIERGELDSVHGQVLIAILLIQDLSLIPLIALLPAMKLDSGDALGFVAIALLKAGLFVFFILWATTRLIPPLLAKVVHSNYRELFLLTIISLCLAIATLAHQLGLSLALGAFLAGITVSESTYGHQALSDLLPLRDLFSTVFFISVGMLLNPVFIAQHWFEVAIFVVALIVGKAIIGAMAARIITQSSRVTILVGTGLAQIGEFSFVLALLAYNQGIISRDLYNLFFAGAVVSLIAAPFLMSSLPLAIRKWSRPRGSHDRRTEDRSKDVAGGMHDHVILCGYGRIGRNLGIVLKSHKIPFVVLELNATITGELAEQDIPFIYGDANSRLLLLRASLREASVLVVTVPDPVAAITIIDLARHFNPNIRIIARAHRLEDIDVFRASGANAVVQPEFEASIEITRLTLLSMDKNDTEIQEAMSAIKEKRFTMFQPDISQSNLSRLVGIPHEEYVGVWFSMANGEVAGKSIKELDIRGKSGATIAAVVHEGRVTAYPKPDLVLHHGDEVFVVGSAQEVETFKELFNMPMFCPLTEMTSDEISTKARRFDIDTQLKTSG